MKNYSKTSWITSIGLIAFFLILYGIINHFPMHRYAVPFLFNEDKIPFLPWTFVIYISAFVQGAIIIHLIPRQFLLKAFIVALCMICIGLLFFVLFPIEYPRFLYPNSNVLIAFFRTTDATGNCYPSLHVSMTLFLASFYTLIETSFFKKFLMWLWTIVIIISVLTTKQHYLIDVIGGTILAIPFIFKMRKEFKKYISKISI